METQEILALFDREQRFEIEYPDMEKHVLPHVVRFVRPAPGMSFVLYSNVDEETADAVIEEQIAYFSANNQPFEWKVYAHDQPPDLKERLVAYGFEAEEVDAIMVLDLQEAPPSLLEPVTADVRQITRDQLDDVIAVEEAVWGGNFEWMRQRMGSHLEIPDYLSMYVAYVEEKPACAGWTYFHQNSQFASLWGGSTVPAYRKRGLYSAVLAARAQEAIGRGYRFLTVDAGPMSRPIVARHGFRQVTEAYACEWKK